MTVIAGWFHVRLERGFLRQVHEFNLGEAEVIERFVRPWRDGRQVAVGGKAFDPNWAKMTIYSGQRLAANQLSMGQGWSNATKFGEDVTARLLAADRESPAGTSAETERERRYRDDALVLGELGRHLVGSELPRVEVRLPRTLAEKAVAAWQRDEGESVDCEEYKQPAQPHRAGALGLIGLSIEHGGRWDGEEVVVELTPALIGIAVSASEDLPGREQ